MSRDLVVSSWQTLDSDIASSRFHATSATWSCSWHPMFHAYYCLSVMLSFCSSSQELDLNRYSLFPSFLLLPRDQVELKACPLYFSCGRISCCVANFRCLFHELQNIMVSQDWLTSCPSSSFTNQMCSNHTMALESSWYSSLLHQGWKYYAPYSTLKFHFCYFHYPRINLMLIRFRCWRRPVWVAEQELVGHVYSAF